MARIVWVIALLSATLVLGGCAGIPYGGLGSLGGAYGGGGYGNAYGSGYAGGYGGGYGGAAYPQGGIPIPVPMDPGYGGGYGAPGVYGQPYNQQQPYGYNNGGYQNQYQAGYPGQQQPQWSADEINQRLQHQDARIQAGIASGQITPEEAQRLQAEQTRVQAAMTRMQANGNNLSPGELARLNQMLNYSGRDINRLSNNGTTVTPPATGTTTTGTGTGTTVAGHGTRTTGTATGTTVAGNGTTTTGTGATVQPGSSPAAQQQPGGPRFGANTQMAGPQQNFNGPQVQQNMAGRQVQPNMAGRQIQPNMAAPRMQPNMAGPMVQPRAVQPAAAPRMAPTAGRRVAAAPGR